MGRKIISLFLMLCTLLGLIACRNTTSADPTTQAQPPTYTQAPTTGSTVPATEPETQPETEATTVPTEPELEDVDFSTLWTPICESYIILRTTPGGSTAICQIPVGAELTLQKWHGKYALVTYEGKQGYVSANYIRPVDEQYFEKRLQVVTPTTKYPYEQMVADMEALQMMYPKRIRLGVIGKSEEGRDIPVVIVGNPDAPHHVLMQGAMHAREHFTAWLLMAIMDNSLSAGLLDDTVCYHIIPMSNPDGVTLSQTQTLNNTQEKIYQRDLAYGYTTYGKEYYAQQWKANGLGIDLNRNFPSGWEGSLEHPEASSSHHRGESPLCAAESKALADYTQSRPFAATFSFHSSGSVLYYRYGNKQPVNDLSYQLALAVQKNTGYTPIGGSDGTSGAGYKDWAMDALGIPSLTVEIGSYTTPLEQRDIYNTFARFENFFPTLSSWLAQ